jgi:hypothetical protein
MKNNSTTQRNTVVLTVGLVFGLSTDAAFAQQELIVNGSFESGAQANMDGLPG